MTIHFNIGEAKAQLSRLIAAALRGDEVVIDKDGVPQVRLEPIAKPPLSTPEERRAALAEILREIDKVPLKDGPSALAWDENGLPI